MVSTLGSPRIKRGRALRTIECVRDKEANLVHAYVCVAAFSCTPLSICLACMPVSVHVCVCVCVCVCGSLLWWGRGSPHSKPWNWLTGASPPRNADCVCAAWNKDIGEYPGDCHLHKTASQHHLLFVSPTHLSPKCIYSNSTHWCMYFSLTHHLYQQSTASTQCKLRVRGGARER